MAKRVIDDSTLTAIADPLRSLLGMSEAMSPAAMATNLGAANDHVDDQTALIAQIIEALEGKTGVGGKSLVTTIIPANDVQSVTVYDVEFSPNVVLALAMTRPDSGSYAVINAYYYQSDNEFLHVATYGGPNNEWSYSNVGYKGDTHRPAMNRDVSQNCVHVYGYHTGVNTPWAAGHPVLVFLAEVHP